MAALVALPGLRRRHRCTLFSVPLVRRGEGASSAKLDAIPVKALALTIAVMASASILFAAPFDLCVTVDDLPVANSDHVSLKRQQSITLSLTRTLASRRIPAVGFVNASHLLKDGQLDPARLDLLRTWLDAGMELGNHTYSHRDLHTLSASEFEEEVVRGEIGVRDLLAKRSAALRWFRHPFLHTGTSAEMRARADAILTERGYRVAPVTIDNSDWVFARAYDAALAKKDRLLVTRVGKDYVAYMLAKTAYYRAQSVKLFGREIPQILLIHANTLNAGSLGTLTDALIAQGAHFVPLQVALADPAYKTADTYYGGAGISWIHRWALSAGKTKEFFAGEPISPAYILKLAHIDSE
jgi:peptidoglycan/xylan/chitin deacetylase (PgdA/CDA1 family)